MDLNKIFEEFCKSTIDLWNKEGRIDSMNVVINQDGAMIAIEVGSDAGMTGAEFRQQRIKAIRFSLEKFNGIALLGANEAWMTIGEKEDLPLRIKPSLDPSRIEILGIFIDTFHGTRDQIWEIRDESNKRHLKLYTDSKDENSSRSWHIESGDYFKRGEKK